MQNNKAAGYSGNCPLAQKKPPQAEFSSNLKAVNPFSIGNE